MDMEARELDTWNILKPMNQSWCWRMEFRGGGELVVQIATWCNLLDFEPCIMEDVWLRAASCSLVSRFLGMFWDALSSCSPQAVSSGHLREEMVAGGDLESWKAICSHSWACQHRCPSPQEEAIENSSLVWGWHAAGLPRFHHTTIADPCGKLSLTDHSHDLFKRISYSKAIKMIKK